MRSQWHFEIFCLKSYSYLLDYLLGKIQKTMVFMVYWMKKKKKNFWSSGNIQPSCRNKLSKYQFVIFYSICYILLCLLEHAMKFSERVIEGRLRKIARIDGMQFGFRARYGSGNFSYR